MAQQMTKEESVRRKQQSINSVITVILSIICVIWMYPILLIVFNSLKVESAISTNRIFELPIGNAFNGFRNFIYGVTKMDFMSSFWYSLFITVSSVALIILCCSMCAWYISRVTSKFSSAVYYLCVFSMVVPFQMVMFTLSKTADTLKLNTPYNICVIYLGFGAGLAVFMFTGFVKQIPIEIEEAAMIDGCTPIQTYFRIILPIMKPTLITVAILDAMWIWNDYLLPSLVLNINKYKTIPIAVQFLKQSHGQVDWGAMMAVLVMAIVPIVVFYMAVQKYIIEGVVAGAVKG